MFQVGTILPHKGVQNGRFVDALRLQCGHALQPSCRVTFLCWVHHPARQRHHGKGPGVTPYMQTVFCLRGDPLVEQMLCDARTLLVRSDQDGHVGPRKPPSCLGSMVPQAFDNGPVDHVLSRGFVLFRNGLHMHLALKILHGGLCMVVVHLLEAQRQPRLHRIEKTVVPVHDGATTPPVGSQNLRIQRVAKGAGGI